MLRGRFGDTTGRPFIEGHVQLVRLGVNFNVSFLLDTGADRTLISPVEGMRMGIDYSRLKPGPLFEGIGGTVKGYEETAILTFAEAGRFLYSYAFRIGITEPRKRRRPPHPDDIAALLGRDVLHQWRMSYNHSRKRLNLTVLSYDFRRPVPRHRG